ncbi:MAG: hypothetical protein JJ891_12690 [Rhizobiaceae bacterium]|nr:hypothetical protein [Rhizobiaceae bacterium]
MEQISKARHAYTPSHPWYYLLDGKVWTPKQIKQNAIDSDYKGYCADDIAQADRMAEPKRSEKLRQYRSDFECSLRERLSRYRIIAFQLHRYRQETKITNPISCDDVHTNMSLVYNHLYNYFALIAYVDECLGKQGDLFG